MLLPVAVALRAIEPLAAAELDDLLDGTAGAELDTRLDEDAITELSGRLDDTTAAELDDLLLDEITGVELGATELGADELLAAPPQTAAVKVAPFLPTPATCASLSFTHCGATGE